jgi:hypothetical protein
MYCTYRRSHCNLQKHVVQFRHSSKSKHNTERISADICNISRVCNEVNLVQVNDIQGKNVAKNITGPNRADDLALEKTDASKKQNWMIASENMKKYANTYACQQTTKRSM